MAGTPDYLPMGFPWVIYTQDFPGYGIPIEKLTDEQAEEYWRQQKAHFLKHLQNRRAGKR